MQLPSRFDALKSRIGDLPPRVLDLVLGTTFVVLGLLSTSGTEQPDQGFVYEPRDVLAYALVLGATVPYFVRRRWPLPVFVVSVASLVALSANDYNEGFIPFIVLVGAYTVGAHRPAVEAAVAAGVAAVVLVLLFVVDAPGFDGAELAANSAIFGSAILVGRNVQSRRLRLAALELGHEEAAARAAADERLRIAQELHDVVAHSLGVIAVQAGVGSHVIDSDPEEARRALDNIAETSRTSLAEIRRLLGVVRDREGAPGYAPAPTLAELPRLVGDVEHAGLSVDLVVDGDVDDLPAGVELAAYRIVQEALTNALRHSGARRATVRVARTPEAVTVHVADDGHGPQPSAGPSGSGGHGLVGMRERAALYGGSVDTGAGPDGGFRVAAELPLHTEPVA